MVTSKGHIGQPGQLQRAKIINSQSGPMTIFLADKSQLIFQLNSFLHATDQTDADLN